MRLAIITARKRVRDHAQDSIKHSLLALSIASLVAACGSTVNAATRSDEQFARESFERMCSLVGHWSGTGSIGYGVQRGSERAEHRTSESGGDDEQFPVVNYRRIATDSIDFWRLAGPNELCGTAGHRQLRPEEAELGGLVETLVLKPGLSIESVYYLENGRLVHLHRCGSTEGRMLANPLGAEPGSGGILLEFGASTNLEKPRDPHQHKDRIHCNHRLTHYQFLSFDHIRLRLFFYPDGESTKDWLFDFRRHGDQSGWNPFAQRRL